MLTVIAVACQDDEDEDSLNEWKEVNTDYESALTAASADLDDSSAADDAYSPSISSRKLLAVSPSSVADSKSGSPSSNSGASSLAAGGAASAGGNARTPQRSLPPKWNASTRSTSPARGALTPQQQQQLAAQQAQQRARGGGGSPQTVDPRGVYSSASASSRGGSVGSVGSSPSVLSRSLPASGAVRVDFSSPSSGSSGSPASALSPGSPGKPFAVQIVSYGAGGRAGSAGSAAGSGVDAADADEDGALAESVYHSPPPPSPGNGATPKASILVHKDKDGAHAHKPAMERASSTERKVRFTHKEIYTLPPAGEAPPSDEDAANAANARTLDAGSTPARLQSPPLGQHASLLTSPPPASHAARFDSSSPQARALALATGGHRAPHDDDEVDDAEIAGGDGAEGDSGSDEDEQDEVCCVLARV